MRKSTDEIYDGVMQKLDARNKAKKQLAKRILTMSVALVLTCSVGATVAVRINGRTVKGSGDVGGISNEIPDSESDRNDFDDNALDADEYGLVSGDVPYEITYEQLINELNNRSGMSSFLPKDREFISILNIFNVKKEKTHFLMVDYSVDYYEGTNHISECWRIDYYCYGMIKEIKNPYNYFEKTKIMFKNTSVDVYFYPVNYNSAKYRIDFGDGSGIVVTYYNIAGFNYENVLNDVFV